MICESVSVALKSWFPWLCRRNLACIPLPSPRAEQSELRCSQPIFRLHELAPVNPEATKGERQWSSLLLYFGIKFFSELMCSTCSVMFILLLLLGRETFQLLGSSFLL